MEGLLSALLPIGLAALLPLLFLLGLERLRASIVSNSASHLLDALRLGMLWNRVTDYCRHSRLSVDFLTIAIPLVGSLLWSLLILRAQVMFSGTSFFLI